MAYGFFKSFYFLITIWLLIKKKLYKSGEDVEGYSVPLSDKKAAGGTVGTGHTFPFQSNSNSPNSLPVTRQRAPVPFIHIPDLPICRPPVHHN